jgi:hypothetical protein
MTEALEMIVQLVIVNAFSIIGVSKSLADV